MSKNFKPLTEQVSEKLMQQLQEGSSVFQQNSNTAAMMPFNPVSGKSYRGVAALILLMKKESDPRWMSLKNASFHNWPVKKDEKGTLISFYKTSDLQPVTGANGENELNEEGKPKYQAVKLKEPELSTSFLFNAAQLKDIPALEARAQEFSPVDRARQILANSQQINLPEQLDFPSTETYYSAILKEIAGQKVAEKGSDSSIKDALKTNIASLFISAELNLPYDLGDHVGYTNSWSQLLKEEPAELFKAAQDAQKITDQVLRLEKKRAQEQQSGVLNMGDVIAYKGDVIKVITILKGQTAQVENSDGAKFKVGPKDGLYAALVQVRDQQQGKTLSQQVPKQVEVTTSEEQTYSVTR